MYNWLKKYIDPVVPLYSILPLTACFALNMIVYSGTMILCADWKHYDLTTSLDRMVPLAPQWMYVYFGCYLFWIANYILVGRIHRDNREKFYRFVATDMMSRLVCAIFFISMPTTNIRPAVTGEGFSNMMLAFLYNIDQPTNLFPSIHCLVSWLCYVGIRGEKKVSPWYRAFSCIFALAVAASTQFTKQHYIADAIAGIFLAEFLFWLNKKICAYTLLQRAFTWLNDKLYLWLKGESCEQ
ncbi:MAG: phosphatase PAP2 family protein [Lachnospiraceae bacterium]|nr:phosphatase PAP2 family protein [Lachnospiraceae bacterium]